MAVEVMSPDFADDPQTEKDLSSGCTTPAASSRGRLGSPSASSAPPSPRQGVRGSGLVNSGDEDFAERSQQRSLSDRIIAYLRRRDTRQSWAASLPPRSSSLPAVLASDDADEESDDERPASPQRRLRLSVAQLIIPRSVSQYLQIRFSKPQSEGLIFAHSVEEPEDEMGNSREQVPRALSDSALIRHARRQWMFQEPEGEPEQVGPGGVKARTTPLKLEEVSNGSLHEGMITKCTRRGVLIDFGSVSQGLVRWKDLRGVPKKLLQKGEVLSNLEVQRVDLEKKHVFLHLIPVGHDGEELEETVYDAIISRIANWASVALPSRDGEPRTSEKASKRRRRRRQQQQSSRSEWSCQRGSDEPKARTWRTAEVRADVPTEAWHQQAWHWDAHSWDTGNTQASWGARAGNSWDQWGQACWDTWNAAEEQPWDYDGEKAKSRQQKPGKAAGKGRDNGQRAWHSAARHANRKGYS
eukprot:TRINITY_DN27469_c0_g2_i1.p1 TRINITY_DN27469_c0_g2~~TRINITY_DN27469_c0_g2_i1.p1  ORF type:complete len:492 (-),score=81.61 TRINITY_DN27469_c0_g2_i1:175-1581(-)